MCCEGTKPVVLDLVRSASWSQGDCSKPRHVVSQLAATPSPKARSPPDMKQDIHKRRRSMTETAGGNNNSEQCGDARRCKQQEQGSKSWLGHGRAASLDSGGLDRSLNRSKQVEAISDWPPWAGGAPISRHSPVQCVALDPGSCV